MNYVKSFELWQMMIIIVVLLVQDSDMFGVISYGLVGRKRDVFA